MDALSQAGYTLTTHLARYPALAVGLPLVGRFVSSMPIHTPVQEHYNSLDRPAWAPPAYLFAPAWASLYLSIGYASHLVALKTGPSTAPGIRDLARTGLLVYGGNLMLSFAWSPLIFWKRKYGSALVTAGGMTTTAIAMSYLYFQVDNLAGYLTLPYIGWLCYATALSSDIWIKYGQGSAADSARKMRKDARRAAKDAKDTAKDTVEHIKDKDL
ncbi:hypothetical protein BGZ59_007761 [Podila verticillata]|nr:hypothetical protein BGZ59_007761 [Podila verticillata]